MLFTLDQLTAKNLPRLDEDERLGPVIDHLAASFLSGLGASEYQSEADGSGTAVTADMVDDVAKKHFPPCMRNLYDRLKRDHHLKHFGRLQLGLFLKASQLYLCRAPKADMKCSGYWPTARRSYRILAADVRT